MAEDDHIFDDDDIFSDDPPENVFVQFPVAGLRTDDAYELRCRVEDVLDAELRASGEGMCNGGDVGADGAAVFLVVHDPAAAVPRLLAALRREALLAPGLVVIEDAGPTQKTWWPPANRTPLPPR